MFLSGGPEISSSRRFCFEAGVPIFCKLNLPYRFEKLVVFQVQLTRGIETLPITRDYMGVAECSLPLAKCGNRLALAECYCGLLSCSGARMSVAIRTTQAASFRRVGNGD